MKLIYLAISALLLSAGSTPATAQILNPKKVLERKAINKTNQVINKKADQVIDKYIDLPGNLMPVLQGVQDAYGYIPRIVADHVAEQIGRAHV